MRDLERGVVRCLHSLSFVEDPTRVLRAARFAQLRGAGKALLSTDELMALTRGEP